VGAVDVVHQRAMEFGRRGVVHVSGEPERGNQSGQCHGLHVGALEVGVVRMSATSLLGLEPHAPARNLSDLVASIGLLPFAVHLGDGADAGIVLLRARGVTVINGALRVGRRRLILAHELGHHLIRDPYATDWRIDQTDTTQLEARLDRFARALLLPEADVRAMGTVDRVIERDTA